MAGCLTKKIDLLWNLAKTVYVDVDVDDIVQEMSPSEKKEMIEALQSDIGDIKENSVLSQENSR